MVRGGWYHFLVLDRHGGVLCLIGSSAELSADEPETCAADSAVNPVCVSQSIPISAPANHPLAVPIGDGMEDIGIKSLGNPGGKAVIDICCGAYHNVVRCVDNTIRCWGLNSIGQCNVPTSSSKGDLTDPDNQNLKRIVGLHAGYSNTAITFNDGTVVCWGDPTVANTVNSWTDIMMSPVAHTPETGLDWGDLNNVATDGSPRKVWYAKPEYSAAYNPSAENTWNINSDPQQAFHDLAWNTHCQPFFDLGVEVDPFYPLDMDYEYLSAFGQISYGTTNPGWPTTFTPCDVDLIGDPASDEWKRYLDMRWRNYAFSRKWLPTSDRKSCCDLEVKTDFAVAVRRTGQIITTRSDNRKSSGNSNNPGCPTGHTNGKSNCRDCSADWEMNVTCNSMSNYRQGCGSPGSFCYQAQCSCCDPTGNSTGVVGNCPDCSNFYCASQQIFTFPSGQYPTANGGCNNKYFEGIGCVSAISRNETLYHSAEWATPHVIGQHLVNGTLTCIDGGLQFRWLEGQQVRDITGFATYPSANNSIHSNWGWSTVSAADTMERPGTENQKCIATHPTPQTSSYDCDKLCKDTAQYENAVIDPDNQPQYDYPVQMRMQAIAAGTDTVAWNNQALGVSSDGMNGDACSACPTWSGGDIHCKSDYLQSQSPNGGIVTYGVIYSGESMGPVQTNVDKYQQTNSYTVNAGFGNHAPCSSGLTMLAYDYSRAPSKPWGPMHMVISNSLGQDVLNSYGYPSCHCCDPPNPIRIAAPNMARVIGSDLQLIDVSLGTVFGMPSETGINCLNPLNEGGNCSSLCADNVFVGSTNVSDLNIPFCVVHPPRSVASTRLAFAIIRADHRDCERSANGQCVLDENGNEVRSQARRRGCGYPPTDPENPSNGPFEDGSQFFGCTQPTEDNLSHFVIRDTQMLHVWGSLWDPCPPWPRLCNCESVPDDVLSEAADWPFGESTPDEDNDYTGPCNEQNPEYSEFVLPENDPEDPLYQVLMYPQWTRRGSVDRIATKRQWVGGVWTELDPPQNEPAGPTTRYCPNCEEWQQQFGVGG